VPGLPRQRLPLAFALFAALALVGSWLQGRFDSSDVRKGITLAMTHRTSPGGPTVFEALVARGEGDPRCDGEIVSALFGDVRVRCATPGRRDVVYAFRVLLDGTRPPRPEGEAAEVLVAGIPAGPVSAADAGR